MKIGGVQMTWHMRISRIATAQVLALAISAAGSVTMADEVVVGGLTPSVRPADAPTIYGVHFGADWYRRALVGVSQPYPKSLFFLDNQGEWYTPFTRPGMPGVYDIRGLHSHK